MEPWIVGSEPSERYPLWTRANVGEVFPDSVAPFTPRCKRSTSPLARASKRQPGRRRSLKVWDRVLTRSAG